MPGKFLNAMPYSFMKSLDTPRFRIKTVPASLDKSFVMSIPEM